MTSRRLELGCAFTFDAAIETTAVFQVQPGELGAVVLCSQEWSSTPDLHLRGYTDVFGNPCTRALLPDGISTLRYDAVVLVPDEAEEIDPTAAEVAPDLLPDETLIFTLPSRYCLPDVLGSEAWDLFGLQEPGYARVQAICDHVNKHLTFQYGSTTSWSTSVDVNSSRLGVCRDFTHLAITFCRALNIPARYVFGYLPYLDIDDGGAEMDFAAWMEVWLDGRWWTFDPRNNSPRKGRVVIGRGCDAADVAMVTTFGGPQLLEMTVKALEVTAP
ncbi:MAG: transglutaminase family protein [Frankiales bacterium]|nr:transglutaminase family protein [Frankiales bacterium]